MEEKDNLLVVLFSIVITAVAYILVLNGFWNLVLVPLAGFPSINFGQATLTYLMLLFLKKKA